MAIRFDASTDTLTGGGWAGTAATILLWVKVVVDRNASSDPWLVTANASGAGTTRGLLGTPADGTTLTLYDSAFTPVLTGPNATVGTWYCIGAVMNGTTWTLYHGTNPASLTTVGPGTRVQISSPGSLVLSPASEWLSGDIANLKVWQRALSGAEVAAELARYDVLAPTDLVRAHSFLTTSLAPDSGSGGSFTAGATGVAAVAGPISIHGLLAGALPTMGAALAATQTDPGVLAGALPVMTGALAATQLDPGVLAGALAVATAALTATQTDPGVLAGALAVPVAALLAEVPGAAPPPLAAYGFGGAGSVITDDSGNGHSWTLGGSAIRSGSGHTGGGLATNGGGATATLADPAFAQTTNRTVMCWMLAPENTTQWVIRWNVESIDSGAWGFLLLGTEVSVQARNASGFIRATCTRPTDGLWHHYAATWDNAAHTLRFYLDGVLTDTDTTLTAPLRSDADTIDIGEWTDTATVIDDLRMFDAALSALQITSVMNDPVVQQDAVLAGSLAHPVAALAATQRTPGVLAGVLAVPVGTLRLRQPVDLVLPARAGTAVLSTGPTVGSATVKAGARAGVATGAT